MSLRNRFGTRLATIGGLVAVMLVTCGVAAWGATKTWDGGAGTSNWSDASNWNGDVAPVASDDVVLDNSLVSGTYTVNLPTGSVQVVVHRLTITPGTGNTITLVLPSTNTYGASNHGGFEAGDATALTDDIILNSGAILQNSSGAGTGNGVQVDLSGGIFRINNGGKYIHNTGRSTAGVVPLLSTAVGTELGEFEQDNPGTSSASPSFSGRTYGSLTLTRTAGAGTYTVSGGGAVTVRGNLKINSGVTLSSSMTGAMNLYGSLTNNGAALTIPTSGAGQNVVFQGSGIQLVSGSASITLGAGSHAINAGSIVALAAPLTTTGTLSVNGTLQLNAGGSVLGIKPTYGSTSTLIYAAPLTVGNEWVYGFTPGLGVPPNVTIQAGTGNTVTWSGVLLPVVPGNLTFTSGTFTPGKAPMGGLPVCLELLWSS